MLKLLRFLQESDPELSEDLVSSLRFCYPIRLGQFGGERSLIMKRRMRQATTIIVLNIILIDIKE